MQKLVNVVALLSGLVSLSVVGGGAYLYLNKEAMIEDAVNVVTVTYIAGQNRATSERTEFIPKSNPIRLGNSVNLLNRIEAFTTEVTALGL